MKTSGSKTGGIVVIIVGAFLTIMFLSFAIYNVITMFAAPASEWPPDPYSSSNNGLDLMKGALAGGMFFLALCCVPLIIIGVYSLKRGVINQKVATEGRKSTCVIEDLRCHHTRTGWHFIMVVSYKDDNGANQRYSTRIPRDRYEELKVGMTLECLVSGDECYIDPMNIIEADNPID